MREELCRTTPGANADCESGREPESRVSVHRAQQRTAIRGVANRTIVEHFYVCLRKSRNSLDDSFQMGSQTTRVRGQQFFCEVWWNTVNGPRDRACLVYSTEKAIAFLTGVRRCVRVTRTVGTSKSSAASSGSASVMTS